jgi:WD40 repeat protein
LKGTWGRDVILITLLTGIYRVPPTGGAATLLATDPDRQTSPIAVDNISFLPDGEHFIYLLSNPQQDSCIGSVAGMPRSCGIAVRAPMRYAEPGHVLFIQDGVLRAQPFDAQRLTLAAQPLPVTETHMADRDRWYAPPFSASGNGVLAYHPNTGEAQLVWFNRAGHRQERIGSIETNGDAALSRNGARVAFGQVSSASGNRELWLHDIAGNRSSRFVFDTTVDTKAIFSPDGKRVVFKATSKEGPGLYAKDVDGAAKESRITSLPPSAVLKDWSSDGQYILYQASHPSTDWDLWVVPADGGSEPAAVVNTNHGEREGRFSPDGHWIAYDSTESGRREIWVEPFPSTGSRWQVSTNGGFSPRWNKDGKELFYIATDGRMMAVPISLGKAAVFDAARPLFQTMMREAVYGAYEVAADGQRFLINVPPDGRDAKPITVIVNWTERLRR